MPMLLPNIKARVLGMPANTIFVPASGTVTLKTMFPRAL